MRTLADFYIKTANAGASRLGHALASGTVGSILGAMNAPEGDKLHQAAISGVSDAIGASLGPAGMLVSPAINAVLQKVADHADDRLKERIQYEFPKGTLDSLREQAAKLEVSPGRYYLPLKGTDGNTKAVAAFKTVGPKDKLVLATILKPEHRIKGTSLSHLLKTPVKEAAEEDAPEGFDWKKTLPYLGAALGGYGAYRLARTPQFSSNPALRAIQERANRYGYKRIVDVSAPHSEEGTPMKGVPLPELPNVLTSAGRKHIPGFLKDVWKRVSQGSIHVDPDTGKLSPLDRFKLWAREGESAVPVASSEGKLWAANTPQPGKVDLGKGVVVNRTGMLPFSEKKVRSLFSGGGVDLEGAPTTQRALTEMAAKGKGFEADLLQRYAPESIPKSYTNLTKYFKGKGLPADRYARIAEIQNRMRESLKSEGVPEFALKPVGGLQSDGAFAFSKHDWSKQLKKYDAHMANPKNRKAYDAAVKVGPGEVAWYLDKHNLLPGHTLHHMLKDPRSAMAQHWLPNANQEWRVHSFQGEIPTSMMLPRYFSKDPVGALRAITGLTTDDYRKELQAFSQDVLNKLPEKYRKGHYGMDVMRFVDPKTGKQSFKVMELNPAETAGMYGSEGGGSGLMSASAVPWMGHLEHKFVTGRHSQPVSLAAGMGGAGLGTAAGLLAKHYATNDEEEAPPHPVG